MWILGLRGRSLNVSMIYILHTTIHTFPKVVMRIYLTIEILMISFFQLQSLRGKEQTAFLYTHATIKKPCVAGQQLTTSNVCQPIEQCFFFSTGQSWCLLKFWYKTGGPEKGFRRWLADELYPGVQFRLWGRLKLLFFGFWLNLGEANLKALGSTRVGSMGDLLKLLNSITEVCYPLKNCQALWNSITSPVRWQNT